MTSFIPSSTPHLMGVNGFVFYFLKCPLTVNIWEEAFHESRYMKVEAILNSENWIHHLLVIW